MADKTLIGWTDATWNIITGCSMVSAGCTNCYAMGLAGSRLRNHPSRAGLTRETAGRHVWTGELRFNVEWLDQPLRWKRTRRIFVCAHGDLFHEAVPDEWIDRVFAVMALCPQHTFQVLTKRPERMREYFEARRYGDPWAEAADYISYLRGMENHAVVLEPRDIPLPNVWLGTSIEDQATADARIPHLLQTPAAIRFVSAEPLLGCVDLTLDGLSCVPCPYCADGSQDPETGLVDCPRCDGTGKGDEVALDLVIVGGESGPRARPAHPDWVRSLRDQCVAAGVAFYFKQWGEWVFESQSPEDIVLPSERRATGFYRVGKKAAGRLLDGRTWDEMPGVRDG